MRLPAARSCIPSWLATSLGAVPTSGNWDACLISSRQSISASSLDVGMSPSTEAPRAPRVGGVSDRGASCRRVRRKVSSRRRSWPLASQDMTSHGRVEGQPIQKRGWSHSESQCRRQRRWERGEKAGQASGRTPSSRIVRGDISLRFHCLRMVVGWCTCFVLYRCWLSKSKHTATTNVYAN